MIPLLQNDYYKYIQMFRGNFLKGATLFRSLLNDPNTREQLISNLPALSAVFTDFSKTEANRLCYDIISNKSYFEDAVMFYLRGVEATTHTTMSSLINDEENIIEILGNKELQPIFHECVTLYRRVLEKQDTLDLLKKDANTRLMLDDTTLSLLSSIGTRTSANIYTAYNTLQSSLNGQTCPFDANETYYSFSTYYEFMDLDEEKGYVFLPVQIRTRVGTTSTYYYYPAIFKYTISTKTWTLLYTAMTTTKQTNSTKMPMGVAFDSSNNHVYLFYRPDTTAQVNCDIINVTTGGAVVAQMNVGAVGNASYIGGIFCCWDKTYNVAKFVWKTYQISSTSTTYGWLYGCSVNRNGVVWSGIVATPAKDTTCYASEMQETYNQYRLRCTKGAYVAVFSNSSANSTAVTFCCIVHSGNKMTAKYFSISANSDYSDYYNPSSAVITENGLLAIYCNSAQYQSSNYNLVMVIDVNRGKLLKTYTNTTSYTFSVYVAPLLNKIALKSSVDGSKYIIIGQDENGNLVEHQSSALPSAFTAEYVRALGTDRYKLYTTGSSNWLLYDYKGGFIA